MNMEPNYGWPFWVIAVLISVSTVTCATQLDRAYWLAAVTMFGGVLSSSVIEFVLWVPIDPIAVPYWPVLLIALAVWAFVLAIAGRLATRGRPESWMPYRFASLVLVSITSIGLVAVAGNGIFVKHKIERDQPIAEKRTRALYRAAAQAIADGDEVQNAYGVRSHYSGPAFSNAQWDTVNYLEANGYQYRLYVIPPVHSIVIYALPIDYLSRPKAAFCLDDSGMIRCPLNLPPHYACVPCK